MPWPENCTEVLLLHGGVSVEASRHLGVSKRLRSKTAADAPAKLPKPKPAVVDASVEAPEVDGQPPSASSVSPIISADGPAEIDDIQLQHRKRIAIKPSVDLKDLQQRSINTNDKAERMRLLTCMHECFWHAPPADMMRLLETSMLPK